MRKSRRGRIFTRRAIAGELDKIAPSTKGFYTQELSLCVTVSLSYRSRRHLGKLCALFAIAQRLACWHGMKGRWLGRYTKSKCNLALDPPGFLCLLCPLFFLQSVVTGQSNFSAMLVWLSRLNDRTQLRANGCQALACSGTLTRYSVSSCLICHSALELHSIVRCLLVP